MQDVVKTKKKKLMDARVVYSISDNFGARWYTLVYTLQMHKSYEVVQCTEGLVVEPTGTDFPCIDCSSVI